MTAQGNGFPTPSAGNPPALTMAEAEHNSRLRRLDAIKEEIDELTMAIDALS